MSNAASAQHGHRKTHNESAAHQDSTAASNQAEQDNLPTQPVDHVYFWSVVITGLAVLAGLSARAMGWLTWFGA